MISNMCTRDSIVNGVMERRYQTLIDIVRLIIDFSSLPIDV